MLVKQISVFVENKKGRLVKITNTLKQNNINIRALSIADTTDFGILRIIVSDPQKAYDCLKESGFTVKNTEVIAISIEDEAGGLHSALEILNAADIGIEYMYAFISKTDKKAMVILRVEDNQKAIDILQKNNIHVLSTDEAYSNV